jgi:hypothetical protein
MTIPGELFDESGPAATQRGFLLRKECQVLEAKSRGIVFGSFTTAVSLTMLLPFLPIFVEALGVKEQASIVSGRGWRSAQRSWERDSLHRFGAI